MKALSDSDYGERYRFLIWEDDVSYLTLTRLKREPGELVDSSPLIKFSKDEFDEVLRAVVDMAAGYGIFSPQGDHVIQAKDKHISDLLKTVEALTAAISSMKSS